MSQPRIIQLALLLCLPIYSFATFNQIIPVSYYGWLDQYSITDRGFVGKEACVPTSSTNGMTFLQNVDPEIFGTQLTGTTYADWMNTDEILIDLMNTTVGNGTSDDRFVWGLSRYLQQDENFPQVQFSGIFPADAWTARYPQPFYITSGHPTIPFISNALAAGSALLVGITYNDGFTGGGHELVFNGLTWDPSTNTGTAYFVDPLDPSQNYTPAVPTGPVKQTQGSLAVNPDGSLELSYRQYHDKLPYTGNYLDLKAVIDSVLSVGGSFYAANGFTGTQNAEAILGGLEQLDPTITPMLPILAVLNTTSSLEEALLQFDPSFYNDLIFTAENVAHQLEIVLNNNLSLYRNPTCCCQPFNNRVWAASFDNYIYQKGAHHTAEPTYRNAIGGGVLGLDLFPCENLLVGGGLSYAFTRLKWENSVHGRSNMNSYGAFIYSAWTCNPLWIDANFNVFYNRMDGRRCISIASTLPYVLPLNLSLRNKNKSTAYTGYIGVNYDLCSYECVDIWPYLNVNYTYVNQSGINQRGDGILNLQVNRKDSNLIRSELGVGFTFNYDYVFLDTKLGYANESRFSGKKSTAYFGFDPSTQFSVYGTLPQNNLFCVTMLLRSTSLCDRAKVNLAYHGEFGSKFACNEVSAELSIGF